MCKIRVQAPYTRSCERACAKDLAKVQGDLATKSAERVARVKQPQVFRATETGSLVFPCACKDVFPLVLSCKPIIGKECLMSGCSPMRLSEFSLRGPRRRLGQTVCRMAYAGAGTDAGCWEWSHAAFGMMRTESPRTGGSEMLTWC